MNDPRVDEESHWLSPLNSLLVEYLQRAAPGVPCRIDLRSTATAFLRNYDSRVSRWPIFLPKAIVDGEFAEIVASIPRICYDAIRAYFNGDGQAFSNYFGWPRVVYDLLAHAAVDPGELIARYDVVLAPGTTKLLELNCSSSAGGWQTDWLAGPVREAMREWSPGAAKNVSHRRIFERIARHIVQSIRNRKQGRASGNVLLYAFVQTAEDRASLLECLNAVYEEVKPEAFVHGKMHLFSDFSEIAFSPAGDVLFGGMEMDAVLLTFPNAVDIPEKALSQLHTAYLARKIAFPDSAFHTILDNKLIFALVHECRERGLLTPEDARTVQRYIPWSANMRDRVVAWRGARAPLAQVLATHQHAFVIKKADSFGGQHVVIGKFTTAKAWADAIAAALTEPGWIAQEYCAPGHMLAGDPIAGTAPFDLIWGVFGVGRNYGGAFIRGLHMRGSDGVINSANGAVEFLVFETAE